VYFWYIFKKYLKNFLLILFSLSFFYVIIDLIANYSKLPDSSNLHVLYVYYVALNSIDVFYPLALVFAFLFTVYYMIKFNELVSFYSLGFTVKKLIKPFFFLALIVFTVFVILESGKFAYVREYADSILNKKQYADANLFVKYEDKIVYIKKLTPVFKRADGLKIFYLQNNKIVKILTSPKAVFKKNIWFVKDAEITYINDREIKTTSATVYVLKNFKPKIISNLKNLNSISLTDAYTAMKLFKDVNVNMLLSIVFFKIFTALSMVFLLIVLMFKTPVHQRISNISLFLVKSVLFTILVWGTDLMIYKFAKQGVLSPYVLAVPFVFILSYGIFLLYKEK